MVDVQKSWAGLDMLLGDAFIELEAAYINMKKPTFSALYNYLSDSLDHN